MVVLMIFLTFLLYSAFGFGIFFFGSKLSERPLEVKEAVMAALGFSIVSILTSFLGGTGVVLTLFFTVSLLVKVYDCGLVAGFLLTIGAMLTPAALLLLMHSCDAAI